MSYNLRNNKKIFNSDRFRLVDETGEVFATGINGVGAELLDDNHMRLYFQSSYFKKLKEAVDSLRKSSLSLFLRLELGEGTQ